MPGMPPHLDPVVARRLLDVLQQRRAAMTDCLAALVALESPSFAPETQRPVQDMLVRRLDDIGYAVRRVDGRRTGGYLYARPRARSHAAQLLIGHTDTVWPLGTLAHMPLEIDGAEIRGPGVFDMKGGLVQMVFALEALHTLGLRSSVAPLVLINSDEEIGSRESAPTIRRLARLADRALILEPGLGPDGRLKTARKGVGKFTVTVHGRSAHAGLEPEAGASAIHELAHVIHKLVALNDPAGGVSVNVGIVEGGLRSNVVAPDARAEIDVRVPTPALGRRVEADIHGLTPTTPGTRLSIGGDFGRPPLERTPANRRLWELAQDTGRALGLALDEAAVGGASDGNLTSAYTATLDGLGAIGDGAHARHEFVRLDRMAERAALLALLVLAPQVG